MALRRIAPARCNDCKVGHAGSKRRRPDHAIELIVDIAVVDDPAMLRRPDISEMGNAGAVCACDAVVGSLGGEIVPGTPVRTGECHIEALARRRHNRVA